MLEVLIRPVTSEDIQPLAKLYMDIYLQTNNVEKWTVESTNKFISYFYEQCEKLFFVAEHNRKIIGGVWGQVKPWWNGNKVYNLEIFVDSEYRKQGISKHLFRRFFEQATCQYDAITVEATTFNDRSFPQNYYERIGLKKSIQLVLLEGNIADILIHL